MISYVLMNGGARFKVNINRPKGQVRFKIKNLRIFVKQPLGWVCFYFYVKEYAYPIILVDIILNHETISYYFGYRLRSYFGIRAGRYHKDLGKDGLYYRCG